VEVDVTVKNPRARVICHEADCSVARSLRGAAANADDITANWVLEIVGIAIGAANDVKRVPVQM